VPFGQALTDPAVEMGALELIEGEFCPIMINGRIMIIKAMIILICVRCFFIGIGFDDFNVFRFLILFQRMGLNVIIIVTRNKKNNVVKEFF